MTIFSERLKEIRQKKQLTQNSLSNMLNISQGAYANWENGKREPNFELLLELAKILNVSTDYLLGIENNTPTSQKDELERRTFEIYDKIEEFHNEIEPRFYNVLENLNNQEIKCDEASEILNKIIFVSKRRYSIDIKPLVETMINRWIELEENKKLLLELIREGKF